MASKQQLYRSGLIVGKFAPLHKGHQYLIETAQAQCERVIIMVWSNPDFPSMPTAIRADWIRRCYPDATVCAFDADLTPHNQAPALEQQIFTRQHLPFPIDAVFSSEDYGPDLAAFLEAEHVAVDAARATIPISGTMIRQNIHEHRSWMPPEIYAHFVEKVVFLGAESTGKSTLTQALADRLKTTFVAEYGRTLWEEQEGHLKLDDFKLIAQTHRSMEEDALLQARRFMFVDTNALTTQLYAFFCHGTCPAEVLRLASQCATRYHHVFVCAPDFSFEDDGTRVHPQVQRYMDGAIRNDLTVRGILYHVLHGPLEERITRVLEIIKQFDN